MRSGRVASTISLSQQAFPIELAVIDYGKKELGIFEVFYPTGDIEQDLATIRSRYDKSQAKYPEQFTP